MVAWLRKLGPDSHLAVEALGCNRWFVRACREVGLKVLVIHAADLGLKNTGKKTDRRDAREISRRLYLGDLERHALSYFPSEPEYGQRKVLRVKHKLVAKRTSIQAEIRGLLNAHLLRPPGGDLHAGKQLDWLRCQDLGETGQTLVLHVLADVLEALQAQIRKLIKEIERLARADSDARWIMEHLPQAGPHTALALRAELGDATRFRGARQAASYGGVVPRVTASADRAHHGRLTKRGNSELRVKAWAQSLRRRMHVNKVRMALARRLLVGIWVMFSRGEAFSLERCLGRAA